MNQEISGLTAENLQFRQAGSPGLAEATVGQTVQTAISNANPRSNERHSLVDNKGLGKPPMIKESSTFTEWLKMTTGFLIAACGSAYEALDRQCGPTGAEPVEDAQEKSEQAHVALLALTERAAPSGLEALIGPSLGSSEWREAQSSSAINLVSRSKQTARPSRRT